MNIQVKEIPEEQYPAYRHDVMFHAYKWDLQAGEQSTIGKHAILLDQSEAAFLARHAEALYEETVQMETRLKDKPHLGVELGLSQEMADQLCACKYEAGQNIRFMRFDFHPTHTGWAISEVNSDVPAGYPEASVLPERSQKYFDGYVSYGSFGKVFAEQVKKHLPPGSTLAYVHDTHIVEDYQILRFLGDCLEGDGYKAIYLAPNNIKWEENCPQGIDGIFRHYPVEWMECTEGTNWRRFLNSTALSSNHPIALLTQSKRLPLVWDELGLDLPMWKKLLPKTICPSALSDSNGWILKPAFGRVGEGINIPDVVSQMENEDIFAAAQKDKKQWVAQELFYSKPVEGLHLCVGVFVIDGMFAGFYGRGSDCPKMDENAIDLPVLVKKE